MVRRLPVVVFTNIALIGAVVCLAPLARVPAVRAAPAASAVPAASAASLVDLHDPSDLRAAFNADRGKVRLVLLVSPT